MLVICSNTEHFSDINWTGRAERRPNQTLGGLSVQPRTQPAILTPVHIGQRCPKGAGAGAGVEGQEGGEAHLVRGGGGGGREGESQDPKMGKTIQESLREEL